MACGFQFREAMQDFPETCGKHLGRKLDQCVSVICNNKMGTHPIPLESMAVSSSDEMA